jgi:hypothetical protein
MGRQSIGHFPGFGDEIAGGCGNDRAASVLDHTKEEHKMAPRDEQVATIHVKIMGAQARAAAARDRWRQVMFDRPKLGSDDRQAEQYDRLEARARAERLRADLELFRLAGRSFV